MFCCKCGTQLPDGSAFCCKCGSPVAAPAPVVEAPAPAPVVEAPAPAPVVEAPAPAPVVVAPAPAPVVEAPAPAPVVEAPAPAPVVEAPAPAPVVEAPVPAPVVEAPAPAPVVEAPAPAPVAAAPASRFCTNCGSAVENGVAFCTHCGKPMNGAAPVAAATPVVAAAPVAVAAPAVAPAPAAAPAPKKKGKGLLIAIIAIVAALAVTAGALWATGVFDDWFGSSVSDDEDEDDKDKDDGDDNDGDNTGNGGSNSNVPGNNVPGGIPSGTTTTTTPIRPSANAPSSSVTTQPPVTTTTPAPSTTTQPPTRVPAAVSYTKGTYENGVYTNKWAELKYTPSGEWENGSAAEYAAFQNATTECGLCIKRVNREEGIYDANLSIAFENVKSANVTVDEYVEILRNTLNSQYAAQGYTVSMSDPMSIGLANYYWQEFDMNLNSGALYQRMMIAEKDGYILCITITAMDSAELNRLARNLTFYIG